MLCASLRASLQPLSTHTHTHTAPIAPITTGASPDPKVGLQLRLRAALHPKVGEGAVLVLHSQVLEELCTRGKQGSMLMM